MIAKRIKSYGPNMGLYRCDEDVDCPVIDEFGRPISTGFRGNFAVREINFAGFAKGKTGSHRLDADNTERIMVLGLRVRRDGRAEAYRWILTDQRDIDRLYSQRHFVSM